MLSTLYAPTPDNTTTVSQLFKNVQNSIKISAEILNNFTSGDLKSKDEHGKDLLTYAIQTENIHNIKLLIAEDVYTDNIYSKIFLFGKNKQNITKMVGLFIQNPNIYIPLEALKEYVADNPIKKDLLKDVLLQLEAQVQLSSTSSSTSTVGQ